MARLVWSPSALLDLETIAEFIARDSPEYARLFVQHLFEHAERVRDHPHSGRIVPEYDRDDLREIIFGNYRIVYRLRGGDIEVAAVVHGARRLPERPPT